MRHPSSLAPPPSRILSTKCAPPCSFLATLQAQDLATQAEARIKAANFQDSFLLAKGYGLAKIEHNIPNTPPHWRDITIHHLLTHSSCIPNDTSPTGPPLEYARRFANLPLDCPPGTAFRYNNSGYFLLGVIIEQTSHQTYENYLRQHIFEPLQMTNSVYAKNKAGAPVNAEFIEMGHPYSAGSLYSTRVLTKASLESAFTPNPFEWGPAIQYGYGWGITQLNGRKAVGHGGGINGFSTVIWRAIEDDATAIVLSNTESDATGALGKALVELLVYR